MEKDYDWNRGDLTDKMMKKKLKIIEKKLIGFEWRYISYSFDDLPCDCYEIYYCGFYFDFSGQAGIRRGNDASNRFTIRELKNVYTELTKLMFKLDLIREV